jgi:hypothetical protein
MKITSSDIKDKINKATQANQVGWLDTVKMQQQGIKASQFTEKRLNGYERPENPFRECQIKKPRY